MLAGGEGCITASHVCGQRLVYPSMTARAMGQCALLGVSRVTVCQTCVRAVSPGTWMSYALHLSFCIWMNVWMSATNVKSACFVGVCGWIGSCHRMHVTFWINEDMHYLCIACFNFLLAFQTASAWQWPFCFMAFTSSWHPPLLFFQVSRFALPLNRWIPGVSHGFGSDSITVSGATDSFFAGHHFGTVQSVSYFQSCSPF
jgi:hypothetical protein